MEDAVIVVFGVASAAALLGLRFLYVNSSAAAAELAFSEGD